MAIARLIPQIRKRWFLVSLVVLIVSGLYAGSRLDGESLARVSSLIRPTGMTAVILFLMSFSLDGSHIRRAIRYPGPVLWSTFVNMGLLPLFAWFAMDWQTLIDFQYGILIAGCVPCTLAAASVWTRKAGGNDAISLLVTLLTNGVCFVVTPFWLNLASKGDPIGLDAESMVFELGVYVMVPTLAGQIARMSEPLRLFADLRKHALGAIAQVLILLIILRTSLNAGAQVGKFGSGLTTDALLVVWVTCIVLHCLGLAIGVFGALRLRLPYADQIAVAFASSQKTLPIGILLATNEKIFGNPNLLGEGRGVPFAVFPMLIYHASQLFIDTIVADRAVGRRDQSEQPGAETPVSPAR